MNTSFGIARRPAMALQFQCVAVALVLGLFSPASLWAADGERTVVLLFDGPSEYNDALSSLFREELESHAGANHALRFEASLCADWTAEGIEQMVQDAVASKAGLIIALGVGASQQLSAERGDGRTLRFAPFFIDASWQELHNASRLATLAWPFSIPTALQSFIELGGTGQAPNLQEVGGTGQAPNRQEVGGTGQAPNR
ncbi:MAG: hypothetical protein RBU37_24680, partial [Myxococcota bacterium]|nr:hypothetical protein [Myxococcota bacterium]